MHHVLLFLLTLLICGTSCTDEELWGSGTEDDNNGGGEPPPDGEPSDAAIYGVNAFTGALFTIDPDTGRLELIGPLDPDPDTFSAPTAMAVRASDDAIFVWNNANGNTTTGVLLRVDRCTGLGTPMNPTTPPQGRLDGIAFQGSRLWGVGPAAGSTTTYALYEVITSTGFRNLQGGSLPPIAGLAADSSGTLHGIQQTADGNDPLGLFAIDTVAATAMRIADMDDRLVSGASLTFDGDVLFGTGESRNGDSLFFEIDPMDGDIRDVLEIEQIAQGIGISARCSSTEETSQNGRSNDTGPEN